MTNQFVEDILRYDTAENMAEALDQAEEAFVQFTFREETCAGEREEDIYLKLRFLRDQFYKLAEVQAMEKEFMNSPKKFLQENSRQEG